MRLTKRILEGIILARQVIESSSAKELVEKDKLVDIQKGADWAAGEISRRSGLKEQRKQKAAEEPSAASTRIVNEVLNNDGENCCAGICSEKEG